MKGKQIVYLALSLLIIFNVLLIYQVLTERMKNNYAPLLNVDINLLREQLLFTISMDEIELYLDLEEDHPILCYYASDIYCNTCLDSIFSTICKMKEKYNGLNIAFLARYRNRNELNIFLRQHKFKGVVLDINSVENVLFKSDNPLLFIYHPKYHKSSEVYRPIMSDMQLTKKYLNIVIEKYFN